MQSSYSFSTTSVLLNKLETVGVNYGVLEWFHAYLTGRTQTVDGVQTCPLTISNGVPHGPIIGLFLFTLYINIIISPDQNFNVRFATTTRL